MHLRSLVVLLITALPASLFPMETVKLNFGIGGIYINEVTASRISDPAADLQCIDVPYKIESGSRKAGAMFFQCEAYYRHLLHRSFGVFGSFGYFGYTMKVQTGPKAEFISTDIRGAFPSHMLRVNSINGSAGFEYLYYLKSLHDVMALTCAISGGYIKNISAEHGYYDYEFKSSDENSSGLRVQDVPYSTETTSVPDVPYVLLIPGIEVITPGYPVGVYLSLEIGKYFRGFTPDQKMYYRNSGEIMEVSYSSAHEIGLKFYCGLTVNFL